MSDQDGLSKQSLDDLIRQLSKRKEESPKERISFQDVKDILQDQGLLESLLKEHVSSSSQSQKEIEQRHQRQRSLLTKGFAAASVVFVGLSAWGGYTVGSQMTVDSLGKSSLSTQEKLNSQIQSLETKISSLEKQSQEYENQVKEKDGQIQNLVSKLSNGSNNNSKSTTEGDVPNSAEKTNTDFDSVSISLQECKRSGKSVICSLNITSKVDQVVGFGYCGSGTKTRFFDLKGIEYRASFTQLASQADNSGCTVETSLLEEVPAKALLVFNDIPLDVKKMKAMEISVSVKSSENNAQWITPQYRDIIVR
jgi:cell division protein FtsB